MHRSILFSFFMLLSIMLSSQSNSSIQGVVQDTLANPLISSTVLLLEAADSVMVDFTSTTMDGSFRFKDVSPGDYIVKSTYIGYIPLMVNVTANGQKIDLETMRMTELAQELMEVVIKEARASITMRGDTVEYDASTFKVPEGSSVEDLLKRLPGIEVERDGSILADGKNVSEVTVDGKEFFGSDPKTATQNLPSEAISKVQVFDRKSEEEEITGATSEAQDKTMNLELKEEFKSGGFGRVVGGVGTEDRRELKGNFNRFNNKIQFSLVGVGNNTGRNGLSWDDYQDFLGSQSFNFGEGTTYGFGGNGGRRRFYFGGSSGNNLESTIQSIFFSGNDQGLPENYNGGVNFNFDDTKTKINSVYYYNNAKLNRISNTNSDKFFQDFIQSEVSESVNDDNSIGHRTEIKLEHEVDSLHTIKFEMNGSYIDQNITNSSVQSLAEDGVVKSESVFNNNTNTNGYLLNSMFLLRKKFKKKGRRLGFNASYTYTQLEDDWIQDSDTEFLDEEISSRSQVIDQRNFNFADKKHIKANLLFVEPISDRFFFQTFANYSDRTETGDRDVNDIVAGESTLNGELSRTFENAILSNRLGTSFRYSHNGLNLTTGLAYQSFDLTGTFQTKETIPTSSDVDQTFKNWVPYFAFNMSPVRNSYISLEYIREAVEPDVASLQAIVDNTNPLYIRIGNPGLKPEVINSISIYGSRNYPLSGIRFYANFSYDIYEERISSNETVDSNLITTFTPVNLEGGNSSNFFSSINFPIIKNKWTARVGFSGRLSDSPALVNEELNNTNTKSWNPSVRLNITPSKTFSLYLDSRYSVTKTEYDINSSQNQTATTFSYGAELTSKLFAGILLNANFDNVQYKNDRFNENRNIPILNASVYRFFMPGNKLEARVSIYDAFNRNIGFNQRTTNFGISQTQTNALGRYLMFSLTYNIKGMKSSVKKDGWW